MDELRFMPAYCWYCPKCGHLNMEPCGEEVEYMDVDDDDEYEFDMIFEFPDAVVCDKCNVTFRTEE